MKSVRALRRCQGSRARSPAEGAVGRRGPGLRRGATLPFAARLLPERGARLGLPEDGGDPSQGRPTASSRKTEAEVVRGADHGRPLFAFTAPGRWPSASSALPHADVSFRGDRWRTQRGRSWRMGANVLASRSHRGSHGPRPCAGPRWTSRHVRGSPVAARPARGPTPSGRYGPSPSGGLRWFNPLPRRPPDPPARPAGRAAQARQGITIQWPHWVVPASEQVTTPVWLS